MLLLEVDHRLDRRRQVELFRRLFYLVLLLRHTETRDNLDLWWRQNWKIMRIEFVQHKDQSKLFLNSEVFKTEKQDLPSMTSHPVIREIKKNNKTVYFFATFSCRWNCTELFYNTDKYELLKVIDWIKIKIQLITGVPALRTFVLCKFRLIALS